MMPNKIQPREYSRDGGIDGFSHETTLGCERELERQQRRLELERELRRESEQVECRQPCGFSLLL